MLTANPIVRQEESEVYAWLHGMGLSDVQFDVIAKVMQGQYADTNPFYSRAKAGTYAYHEGLHSLRHEAVGKDDWVIFRSPKNLEGIRSDSRKAVILVAGVIQACGSANPVKRTKCGTATEEASSMQVELFDDLPLSVPPIQKGDTHYWFMADEEGNAEVSRPLIVKGAYVGFIERNKVVFADGDPLDADVYDNDDAVSDFDIDVARKAS